MHTYINYVYMNLYVHAYEFEDIEEDVFSENVISECMHHEISGD